MKYCVWSDYFIADYVCVWDCFTWVCSSYWCLLSQYVQNSPVTIFNKIKQIHNLHSLLSTSRKRKVLSWNWDQDVKILFHLNILTIHMKISFVNRCSFTFVYGKMSLPIYTRCVPLRQYLYRCWVGIFCLLHVWHQNYNFLSVHMHDSCLHLKCNWIEKLFFCHFNRHWMHSSFLEDGARTICAVTSVLWDSCKKWSQAVCSFVWLWL